MSVTMEGEHLECFSDVGVTTRRPVYYELVDLPPCPLDFGTLGGLEIFVNAIMVNNASGHVITSPDHATATARREAVIGYLLGHCPTIAFRGGPRRSLVIDRGRGHDATVEFITQTE